jgi:hypothetical protein
MMSMAKADSGIPLSEWSGSGATERLHKTVVEYSEATAEQTKQLIRLTRQLVILTLLLLGGLVVQVLLAVVR